MMLLAAFACPPVGSGWAQPASRPASERLPPPRPAELPPRIPAKPEESKPSEQPVPAAVEAPRTGQSACLSKLTSIPGNRVEAAEASAAQSDPVCRVDDPVRLHAIAIRGKASGLTVAFEPAPLLSCAMAAAVAEWLDTSVQPLAQGYFALGLTGLRVGGGQECRRRNRASAGPISEHATGQALDLFAFRLGENGKTETIVVEKPVGLAQSRFLDAIRQSACGAFMTVLGPGSDAAHANHLHVDIQARRSRASRFCQ